MPGILVRTIAFAVALLASDLFSASTVSAAASAAQLTSPSASPDHAAAQRFLARADALRQSAKIPGLAVVVLRGTTVVLAEGLGYGDLAARVPVTPETPFNIASVTKPISAVVALRLVELGQLELDRPLRDYDGYTDYRTAVRTEGGIFFGDFDPDPAAPLTLRHLLSMTANGPPGTRFFYNPPAYSWASRPMAQAAKTAFSELTARLVFAPAGMTRSARIHRALPLPAPLAASLARPYHLAPDGQLVPSAQPGPQGDGAAGGVISTARDLARFDRALTEGKLISAASRQLMWTAGRAPDGRALPYGLGWFVNDFQGEKLLWHTGLWEGAYSALYLKIPGRDLTLILLANSDGLRWEQRFDEAAPERSPFVTAFLAAFSR
jgi:CubicO group peptidase (beta-lactamase class C family)